jgi:dihydrodipicolinate synthase/N-acetylneuraminate lyase
MSRMTLICRNATTFTASGELDEEAFREFLQRLADSGLGFYIASGASGEGHALTHAELGRIYRIGVEVGRGKVPVNANPPEQNTAKAQLEHVLLAVEAGVDVVNIYGPAAWHGYLPTDAEFLAYYDFILAAVRHPVALAPNPIIGYTPKPRVIAEICRKYSQVVAVNLSGQGDTYFIELQDCLTRPVPVYVQVVGSLNLLGLGAAGLLGAEANILPRTHRSYIDNYEAGRLDALATDYADIRRFGHYVNRWNTSSPRWLKMAMRAFRLPGGEGGPRPPYLPEPEPEYRRFLDGLLRLRIREIDDLARAAGVGLPAEAAA